MSRPLDEPATQLDDTHKMQLGEALGLAYLGLPWEKLIEIAAEFKEKAEQLDDINYDASEETHGRDV